MEINRKKGRMSFHPLPTEKPCLDKLPSQLPPMKDIPLSSMNIQESKQYLQYISPACPEPAANGENWDFARQQEFSLPQPIARACGTYFIEKDDGIFAVTEDGDCGKLMLNARLSITKVIEIWEDETTYQEELSCQIDFPSSWAEHPKMISVPKESFKEIASLIQRRIPEAKISTSPKQAWDEYLATIYRRDIRHAKRVTSVSRTGWMTIHGETKYWIAAHSFYSKFSLPDIDPSIHASVFMAGWRFLTVGNEEKAIIMIWLWAHMAFTIYWLQRLGLSFRCLLYLKGATGNLKTATVSEVSNIFDTDRSHATTRMTSTFPSIQEYISMTPDSLICVDDFSNSETNDRSRALENAERVIRAVGDGIFPGKMGGINFSMMRRDTVRCTLVLTGEEDFDLGRSSNLRCLVIPVMEGMFDGKILYEFQKNRNILRSYFSLFVKFLEEQGNTIFTEAYSDDFARYREHYCRLRIPRFVDTAASLHQLTDLIAHFARWAGIPQENSAKIISRFAEAILESIKLNQEQSWMQKPEVCFIHALMQSLNTSRATKVASSEENYSTNEAEFVGFMDASRNQMWLRFSDAYHIVDHFYRKQGQTWRTKEKTIKEALLKAGISDGVLKPAGQSGNQYLRRAKLSPRRWMLVLNMDKVEQVVKTMNEEEQS